MPRQTKAERAAWLEERKTGLGGSDQEAVFSDEPYGCARRLGYERLGVPMDFPHEKALDDESDALHGGRLCEPYIVEAYQAHTGRMVRACPTAFVHPTVPWARVNIDGEIQPVEEHEGLGILEAKLHGEYVYNRLRQRVAGKAIRDAYIRQMQWGLFVRGLSWGAYAIAKQVSALTWALRHNAREPDEQLPPLKDLLYFDVQRDDALIEQAVARNEEFWAMLQRGELADPLPEYDGRCVKCYWRRTCPNGALSEDFEPPPKTEILYERDTSDALAHLAEEYVFRRNERKEAEKQIETLRGSIVDALCITNEQGEVIRVREAVVTNTGGRITYRESRPERWDTQGLMKAPPLLQADDPTLALNVLDGAGVAAKVILLKEQYKAPGKPQRRLTVIDPS